MLHIIYSTLLLLVTLFLSLTGENNSEPEEGEVNDSESEKSGSESDSDAGSDKSEEFNDGYDENLMGDEEDRRR